MCITPFKKTLQPLKIQGIRRFTQRCITPENTVDKIVYILWKGVQLTNKQIYKNEYLFTKQRIKTKEKSYPQNIQQLWITL